MQCSTLSIALLILQHGFDDVAAWVHGLWRQSKGNISLEISYAMRRKDGVTFVTNTTLEFELVNLSGMMIQTLFHTCDMHTAHVTCSNVDSTTDDS